MNPAFWGGLSALGLGTGDFMSRYSGRAIGPANTFLAVLITGCLVLSAWALANGIAPVWHWEVAHLVLLNGVATTVMTVLLYWGLTRGPISVVAPIVASHPVLVVAIAVLLGAEPSVLQWCGMAVTLAGVITVARFAHEEPEFADAEPAHLRKTIWIAVGAALAYTVLVSAGQHAVPVLGDFHTLWYSRWISLVTLLLFFLARREAPRLPVRWWPFLLAQGLCDGGGYLALLIGSGGAGAELAAVTSSTFGAVTVLLAWAILREHITFMQWLGIAAVFAGVAMLTWH